MYSIPKKEKNKGTVVAVKKTKLRYSPKLNFEQIILSLAFLNCT